MTSVILHGTQEPEIERVFLPIIYGRQQEVDVVNCEGEPADWEWLVEAFGDVRVQRGGGATLTELTCDASGISSLRVRVYDKDGPVEGAIVIYFWPGAPLLPEEFRGWYDRGISAVTNNEGRADFAMGHGNYYFPPEGGASSIWVYPNGDLLEGLGMLGGTNHTHLNSEWRVQ